jgi:hypothetical protein
LRGFTSQEILNRTLSFGFDEGDRMSPDRDCLGITCFNNVHTETVIVYPFQLTLHNIASEQLKLDLLMFPNDAVDAADTWQSDIQI